MKRALFFVWMTFVLACQPAHEGHGHDHGDSHAGHSHGTEAPSLTRTVWTDRLEVFVDFSPLVVGEITHFAVHVTDLRSAGPIEGGKVTVSLVQGQKGIRQKVEAPASPGIFPAALRPKTAGPCELIFAVEGAGWQEKIVLDDLEVYADMGAALAAHPHPGDDPDHIDFPREQAWKMGVSSAEVREDTFYQVIRAGGELEPARGNEKTVAATASGILIYKKAKANIGSPVRKGELLFAVAGGGIIDRDLEARYLKAKSTYEKTQTQLLRKTQLYEQKAISKTDFEEAELNFAVAETEYRTVAANYSRGGKSISASQTGFLKQLYKGEGDFVEAGEPLAVIAENKTVTLRADVGARHYHELSRVHSANFIAHGKSHSLPELNGRLLSYGKSISPAQPKVPVYFELDNAGDLLPGSFVEVFLQLLPREKALLIPGTALLEDYGNYSVLVQKGGEGYALRPIQIGNEDGQYVEVLSGLAAGERVVTEGAYQIKMASLSGTVPAHGHAH